MTTTVLNRLSKALYFPTHQTIPKAPVVICDANVLYGVVLRDLLMWLAADLLYKAHWTEAIQKEWTTNLLNNNSEIKRQNIERTIALMNKQLPAAQVSNYQAFIPELARQLPDPHDAHVVAAARACKANFIVTFNLRHFPDSILAKYQLEAVHPDIFLLSLFQNNPLEFKNTVEKALTNLQRRHSCLSMGRYLEMWSKDQLNETAKHLRRFSFNQSVAQYASQVLRGVEVRFF